MPAQLLALTDGPSIALDKPILIVGRHSECDIIINSRKISRKHCAIALVNDYLYVRDLGSTNGLRINGQRSVEGRVNDADELTIGDFRYQVSLNGAPVPLSDIRPRVDDNPFESSEQPIPLAENSNIGDVPIARQAGILGATIDSNDSFVLPEKLRTGSHLKVDSPPKPRE